MRRRRGQQDDRAAGPFAGWARSHRYATWRQLAAGTSWREVWLALVEAVGDLREDDSTDLVILEAGKTPKLECHPAELGGHPAGEAG